MPDMDNERRIGILRRTAREVRNYSVAMRICSIVLGMLVLVVGVLYATSALYTRSSSLTVSVDKVDIKNLQATLLSDDCYIPWHEREVSSLTKSANCSSEVVRNGRDRGDDNLWRGQRGDFIEYKFDKDTDISEIRLVFDSDLNRKYHNMPCNYPLVQTKFKLPNTLIREYVIEGESKSGEKFSIHITDNHQRFVKHKVDWQVKSLKFIPISSHGCEEFRLFDFEVK